MNDKEPIKIICRIITLLHYIIIMSLLFIETQITTDIDIEWITELSENYFFLIYICAIPLIIMMIISLILKYKLENKNKVNYYRIIDVITRTFFTIPATIIISFYAFRFLNQNLIPSMAIGIIIFIILNNIIKFTLKETMDISVTINDNL